MKHKLTKTQKLIIALSIITFAVGIAGSALLCFQKETFIATELTLTIIGYGSFAIIAVIGCFKYVDQITFVKILISIALISCALFMVGLSLLIAGINNTISIVGIILLIISAVGILVDGGLLSLISFYRS